MSLPKPVYALQGVFVLALFLSTTTAAASFLGFEPDGADVIYPAHADGRSADVPHIAAEPLGSGTIQLDGRLDEPVWNRASGGRGFRVWDPDRGADPSEETVFKVAYDTDAIYFAVACLEKDPANISANLSRRDRFNNSDIVSIYIDPYHDRQTGYNFKINPLGVLSDAYMFNDGDRDTDWDTIWQGETYHDDHGWYTEIRIPFSSIRYRPAPDMTWGLQVYRYMHERGEDTSWTNWDRETRGFISRFGELRGLRDVPAARQIEITPYFVQRSTDPEVVQETEFNRDEIDNFQNLGADVKYGVTADLTLNATIQPDFGQVEADPSVLNLSPFETFFSEKRPFFIEGSRFFEHPNFRLFHSRRIGLEAPNSRIRLAGKLTGKMQGNVNVAALFAATDVTRDGQAHNVFRGGSDDRYYMVGRMGKEFRDGNFKFNLMQTATIKTADADSVDEFDSREAFTTGLDFDLNFKNRDYNIQGSFIKSVVDREETTDPLIPGGKQWGQGGNIEIRKRGGTVQGGTWFGFESDRLDINDVGFLSSPDEYYTGAWSEIQFNPEGTNQTFNRGNINLNFWKSWLYAGRTGLDVDTGDPAWSYEPGHRQYSGGNVNSWMQLKNFWEYWWGIELMPEGTQRYETRGGPLISEPTTAGVWWGVTTDTRKRLRLELEGNYYWDLSGNASTRVEAEAFWSQSSAIRHEVSLGYTNRNDDTQYLETVSVSDRGFGQGIGGQSYVFGDIHQRTLDFTLRSNLLFTRNQSLEIYAQPFITVGDYKSASELVTPDSYDLAPYAGTDFDVRDFDFSFTAVNVNLVYRWEYRPGSALFLVWTHARDTLDRAGFHSDRSRFKNDIAADRLFSNEPTNSLLVKVSYWFPM